MNCLVYYYCSYERGGLAQLGEHLPYKQAVIGSSPIVPTILLTIITNGEGSEYYIYAGMAQW